MAHAVSRFWRTMIRSGLNVPTFLFLALRLTMGGFFIWGSVNKNPWNDFGCAGLSQICLRRYLAQAAVYAPGPIHAFITTFLVPNYLLFGWFQFSLEGTVGVLLLIGLLTRGAAILGALWALVITVSLLPQPGYVLPDTVLFQVAISILAVTGGTDLFRIDTLLRPWISRAPGRFRRWFGRWVLGPGPNPVPVAAPTGGP